MPMMMVMISSERYKMSVKVTGICSVLAYSTSKEMSLSSFQNKAVKTIMMSAAADVMYTSRANMVAACPNINFESPACPALFRL